MPFSKQTVVYHKVNNKLLQVLYLEWVVSTFPTKGAEAMGQLAVGTGMGTIGSAIGQAAGANLSNLLSRFHESF